MRIVIIIPERATHIICPHEARPGREPMLEAEMIVVK
jgi:hypothetical protein